MVKILKRSTENMPWSKNYLINFFSRRNLKPLVPLPAKQKQKTKQKKTKNKKQKKLRTNLDPRVCSPIMESGRGGI